MGTRTNRSYHRHSHTRAWHPLSSLDIRPLSRSIWTGWNKSSLESVYLYTLFQIGWRCDWKESGEIRPEIDKNYRILQRYYALNLRIIRIIFQRYRFAQRVFDVLFNLYANHATVSRKIIINYNYNFILRYIIIRIAMGAERIAYSIWKPVERLSHFCSISFIGTGE